MRNAPPVALEYRYPDWNDRVALCFADLAQPYENYWKQSEDYALRVAERFIVRRRYQRLLDLGCGTGRLLPRLAQHFPCVIGVEPDRARATQASFVVREHGLHNVRVIHASLAQLKSSGLRFDVAICSHVIQHIATHDVEPLIASISDMLDPHGLLVLFTSRSLLAADIFQRSSLRNEQVVSERITEEQFNQLIMNDDGILPVRWFSKRTIHQLINTRFHVLKTWVYSDLSRPILIDRFLLRDRLMNLPWCRDYFGRNVMIIARRKVQKFLDHSVRTT